MERRELGRGGEAVRLSTTNWDGFRVEAIPWPTFLKRAVIHADLLRAVLKRSRRAVLEVGVGSGAQSALLSRFVPFTCTVDNDARIVGVARRNLERYGRDVQPLLGDAFRLPFADASFDVALSQGLMEHFDDAVIGALLREQLRVARSVVFSVPSVNYPRQDLGDERLMSPDEWDAIVRRVVGDGYRVVATTYGVDLEAFKYSLLARRRLGSFHVLVTIDGRTVERRGADSSLRSE